MTISYREVISWWIFVIRWEAIELWRSLPGPWWVKILILIVTQAIPGFLDELVLFGILALFRKLRAWREARK